MELSDRGYQLTALRWNKFVQLRQIGEELQPSLDNYDNLDEVEWRLSAFAELRNEVMELQDELLSTLPKGKKAAENAAFMSNMRILDRQGRVAEAWVRDATGPVDNIPGARRSCEPAFTGASETFLPHNIRAVFTSSPTQSHRRSQEVMPEDSISQVTTHGSATYTVASVGTGRTGGSRVSGATTNTSKRSSTRSSTTRLQQEKAKLNARLAVEEEALALEKEEIQLKARRAQEGFQRAQEKAELRVRKEKLERKVELAAIEAMLGERQPPPANPPANTHPPAIWYLFPGASQDASTHLPATWCQLPGASQNASTHLPATWCQLPGASQDASTHPPTAGQQFFISGFCGH